MKKILQGRVVSDKADKTVTVLIERRFKHPLYNKVMTKSKKFLAHNEANDIGEGDLVEIMSTRPISKRKNFKVTKLIEKARG